MLKKFANRIAYKIRRKLNNKTILIDGVRLSTDEAAVPKNIRKLLLEKNYETEERELVNASLQNGDRVLEIGAGIGFVGIACAKICGSEKVLSYEPNPRMKPLIETNYALNGMQPNLRSKVVATAPGELNFYFSDSVLSSSLVDRDQGAASRVEADGISDVIEEFRPTAIVMDAEGAEIDLLRACDLGNVRTIVVEMHPHIVGAEQITALSRYLETLGFEKTGQRGKTHLLARQAVAGGSSGPA